jgi:hypothetical protein
MLGTKGLELFFVFTDFIKQADTIKIRSPINQYNVRLAPSLEVIGG